jgi:hypothetical protein
MILSLSHGVDQALVSVGRTPLAMVGNHVKWLSQAQVAASNRHHFPRMPFNAFHVCCSGYLIGSRHFNGSICFPFLKFTAYSTWTCKSDAVQNAWALQPQIKCKTAMLLGRKITQVSAGFPA